VAGEVAAERGDERLRPALELMRFASPVERATGRYARQEVMIGGVTIPRDIARAPNRHLSFGLATLLRRASGLRLAVEPRALRWRPGLVLRGLEGLPVAVDWARSDGGPGAG
jgi:cytochrome P450